MATASIRVPYCAMTTQHSTETRFSTQFIANVNFIRFLNNFENLDTLKHRVTIPCKWSFENCTFHENRNAFHENRNAFYELLGDHQV